VALPADAHHFFYRFAAAGKNANPVLFDGDDFAEVLSSEKGQPQTVTAPAMLNGRIKQPGAVESWSFAARKGEPLSLELRAAQLGSPLQGVLTLSDAQGKVVGRAEAGAGQLDPALSFSAPADGTYTVQVADRFRNRGGPAFAYRLRLASVSAPGFRLQLQSDILSLPRGGQAKLRVLAEREGGFAGPIVLAIEGLPAGVKASPATIGPGQPATEIPLTADVSTAIGGSRLLIRGTAQIAGQGVTRAATLADEGGKEGRRDKRGNVPGVFVVPLSLLPSSGSAGPSPSVLLAVTLPVPFKVVADFDMRIAARGSVLRRRYKIERGGYTGPLEVSLADRQARHLQGAHGPTLTVPADANEFEYPITLPPWMETGRTCRVCVMTVGVMRDGAVEHQVGYSAIGQNDQIVAVVETGKLGLEAEKTSILARRGQGVTVPVKVARGKGLTGPVKVELILAAHVRGVQLEPLLIPADQSQGQVAFHFASTEMGPFNQPAILRATLTTASGPVTAETKLELVPAE